MRGSGVRTKDDRISLLNYYRASKTVPESLRIQSTKRTATVTRQRSEDIKPVFWLPLPSLKRYSFTMRHSWVLQDGAAPLTTHHACVASTGLDGMSHCLLKSRKLSRGYPASHHLLENKLLISLSSTPFLPFFSSQTQIGKTTWLPAEWVLQSLASTQASESCTSHETSLNSLEGNEELPSMLQH